MATVADILAFMESIAHPYMAESWDNVGLLCGRKNKEVQKILVALDPFRNVIEEAIVMGADLIVTHHPLIFRNALMAVNEDTEAGRCVLTLMEHGVEHGGLTGAVAADDGDKIAFLQVQVQAVQSDLFIDGTGIEHLDNIFNFKHGCCLPSSAWRDACP